jgi:methionyl-tRNA formyltransferase
LKILNIGLLLSGNLGLICLKDIASNNKVDFVLTDKNSMLIYEFCKLNNISVFVGNPRNEKAVSFVESHQPDVLLSINYLFIVEPALFSLARLYAINFHGSLLPKYRGRTPHVWAIINNEKETGVTAHIISEGCDEGDIILQHKIAITNEMTSWDVLFQFQKVYPEMVQQILSDIESSNIKTYVQDESKATLFGKRTAESGLLNWDWQRERIHNWVRAQARPYPGAFTFCNGVKITINRIGFSDFGFKDDFPNGYILNTVKLPIIKTPNGAIKLIEWEADSEIIFKQGEVFNERR